MESYIDHHNVQETSAIQVKKFYETKYTDNKESVRDECELIFLRTFNNWIKSCLIDKSAFKLDHQNLSVLDLCCGKGGDLHKYIRNNFKIYVGVDICLPLLKNAIERIKKMNKMKMKCIFICKNVNEQYIFENESLKDYWFDIVSCQFSMHYHFSSEDNLRVFLKNVSSRLQEGGYFIGTIIDSEILRSKIKKHKSLCFGNEFYQIKFGENEFDKKGFYGKKYGFYLEGLIGDKIISNDQKSLIFVEEYLIDFENFCKVAKEYDLHLREKQSFNDFYLHNMKSNHYSELYEKTVKSKKNKNNKQKWEVIDLYQVFRFQKGSPNRNYISYYDSLKNELILDFNPELIVDKVI